MAKTTRGGGLNNLTIWPLMISRFVPFWLQRKLFETLKIYTAEETEARQEALRLGKLFLCLGSWHGIFNDARWCTRTTSLLSAVKWILDSENRQMNVLVWWNFKCRFFMFTPIFWGRFPMWLTFFNRGWWKTTQLDIEELTDFFEAQWP